MERLILKKLIVVSEKEKKSKEINLSKGLNIIIGQNKTGKSSLIKSIFYTFGCEVKLEDEWKNLIDKYLLFFQSGEDEYCILRMKKYFKLLKKGHDNDFQLIFEGESYHDLSKVLMGIFKISMDCLTNDNKQISITPPLLFRFQYIDQDKGWDNIGQSFNNIKYIKDWKGNTNKYVVGFQGEEYYRIKQTRDLLQKEIESENKKIEHFEEFISNLKNSLAELNLDKELHIKTTNSSKEIKKYSNNAELSKDLLIKINSIEKDLLSFEEELSFYKNERYEKILEINYIKEYVHNLEEDHNFAVHQDSKIKCPFCGVEHENSIENRIEIVKDLQSGNELLRTLRIDIEGIENKINKIISERDAANLKYKLLKKNIEKIKENVSIINTFKNEGKLEILKSSLVQRDMVVETRDKKILKRTESINELKELNSKKRRNEIVKQLTSYCLNVYHQLNIPSTYIKFNDFVQVLSKTGSENPRMIYAYHISLYLYNLKRTKSPFNLLVIDTPNQQGQDNKNLTNIDSVLGLLTTKEGQVLIGTERETGFEETAETVIYLQMERRCLDNSKYNEHIKLINILSK